MPVQLQRLKREAPLYGCAAAMEGAWLVLASLGDLRPAIPWFWMLYAIAFAAYIGGPHSLPCGGAPWPPS